ncbi:MAG: glycoside hydrolase family 2, partial [Anaerolineales bacterium]|nr:glycoside hydrolase family 2 [Anaerolineales bacterium]
QETYRWAKSLDPNRLIVDNSPCCPNFHMQTDLDDYHFYSNIPDHRHKWNKNISTFVTRPEYTFSKSKEAIRTCREPLIVSEFGNWGLPNIDLLLDEDGNEPWWFETGANWADGAAYPHGVKNRFRRLGLDNVFDDWICFIEATQLQQFEALKYEIETIRSQEEISGYVVTELTDVHWESNGLMDMNRNPRVFSHKFASINKDTVIISTWERVSYWPGEPVQVEIKVAHGAGETIRGSRVQWRLSANNAAGCMEVPDIAPGHVRSVGEISFQSPKLQQPMRCNLEFALLSKDGIILASNDLALSFYPRLYGSNFHGYQLWTPSDYLSEYLSGLGYTVTPDIAEADTVVTQKLNNELLAHVRKGGRLLFVADRPDSDKVEIPGVEIISREGTSWQGDWVSTFAWLRRQGSFERIPGGPYLDMTFERVMPDSVINGLKHLDFEADVHAGMFVGWIHKPVALIAEQRSGKGKLILTTFRLFNEKPLSDPVATALVNSLIAQTLA